MMMMMMMMIIIICFLQHLLDPPLQLIPMTKFGNCLFESGASAITPILRSCTRHERSGKPVDVLIYALSVDRSMHLRGASCDWIAAHKSYVLESMGDDYLIKMRKSATYAGDLE